jgi:protein-disulfide isomerase
VPPTVDRAGSGARSRFVGRTGAGYHVAKTGAAARSPPHAPEGMRMTPNPSDPRFANSVFAPGQRTRSTPVIRRGALLGLVTALAAVGACPAPPTNPTDSSLPAELRVTDDDHVLAVGTPTLTVIEYGDFQCPVCQRFAQQTLPTIKADYIDTGKIRWVYRHFPLRNKHALAEAAAEASECAAAQNQFWEYQGTLTQSSAALDDAALRQYAATLGFDITAFEACLTNGIEAARVEQDVQSGLALDVAHTPTFFVGQQVVVGSRTVAEFTAILDAASAVSP